VRPSDSLCFNVTKRKRQIAKPAEILATGVRLWRYAELPRYLLPDPLRDSKQTLYSLGGNDRCGRKLGIIGQDHSAVELCPGALRPEICGGQQVVRLGCAAKEEEID
jgi:hypothetical protein